jgi:transglutaminase-like putative cysteine protease
LGSEPLPANQPLETDQPRGTYLLQQFQRLAPGDDRVYAVNSPSRFDQPVQGWWRDAGDLAYLTSDADLYTVVSFAPEPTSAELRALSPLTTTFPPDVRERYLALPTTVPQRVLNLAQEVVGDAPTYYDQVRAIEHYLRTYRYNLDIPEPPTDRDLVDHFLFELQEGYCDYYASAMVVMARSIGVPTRLASGYVQ